MLTLKKFMKTIFTSSKKLSLVLNKFKFLHSHLRFFLSSQPLLEKMTEDKSQKFTLSSIGYTRIQKHILLDTFRRKVVLILKLGQLIV